MTKKAILHSAKIILISAATGLGTWIGTFISRGSEAIGPAIIAFLLSAVILHIKPELMGKLYKVDETNEDQS